MANGTNDAGKNKDKPTASGTPNIGTASGTPNVGTASGTPRPPGGGNNDPLSDENLERMNNTGTTWHHYKLPPDP